MSIHHVRSDDELRVVTSRLNEATQLAIDLEFDRNFHRYGFNLCLAQIFDGDTCYLIDPLSRNLDASGLFPVLENPEIPKITFAFGEDLRLLHSLGCFPKTIYDIDIATSLLNYPPTSLNNLLEEVLGVDTGKSSQRSNWFRRPLTEDQVRYAAQDVLHLFDLKKVVEEEAKEKEITEWIEEENGVWDQCDYSESANGSFIKDKDKKQFNEVEWHRYKAILRFREREAEKLNRPAFQVIQKQVCTSLASNTNLISRWISTRGIHRRLKNANVQNKLHSAIKNAEKEARELGLDQSRPAQSPLTPEQANLFRERKNRINKLKTEVFKPVKKRIEEEYGKETATFLFSNRFISDIVTGERSEMRDYKIRLLKEYADEMKIDLNLINELSMNGNGPLIEVEK
ncbi:MAG: ribonuclease D [Balneolaceae bacterium]|nr:ribonuclease D [Balneolaceae bacterium]MCH8548309.1 ribonuclease D [Balneolaceae bacterium]